mmetsp:Transcript_36580/g.93509  ORF Transcript_36580/g.93509 Transcript_36580/m.93509 type:complete len:304 (-) Transcript_36580:1898-2809(-)
MPATPGETAHALRSYSQPTSSGATVPVPSAFPQALPGGSMAYQYAYPPGFDPSKVPTSGPAVSGAAPPGTVPIFPIHPAAMYGQMQQMQQQLQAVQQQMSAGAAASIGAPLTTAQQAELARARQRGQRAAIAKQKLIKQKAALAAKRAKATEAAAAKAETAVGKKRKAGKSKKGDDDGEDEDDDTTGDEARPATATAADIQGIEAMDVSALAAMSPDDQLIEIQKRLVGVECVKEQKRLKRLLRNRVSAQQARERKKSYLSSLEDKSREQENDIQALQQKVQSLQQENTMLRQVVKNMRMKDK